MHCLCHRCIFDISIFEPLKAKNGPAVDSEFPSIFNDYPKFSRRPVWVRTDKGNEIQNEKFQGILRDENIQFQVCKKHHVKCAVIELPHLSIRHRLPKYFTYKNTFRYIDVLPTIVRAYNDTVHPTS